MPIIRQGDELSKALVGARRTLAINESIPVLPRTPEELWLRPLPFLSLPLLWQRAGGGKSRLRQMCVLPGDKSLRQLSLPCPKPPASTLCSPLFPACCCSFAFQQPRLQALCSRKEPGNRADLFPQPCLSLRRAKAGPALPHVHGAHHTSDHLPKERKLGKEGGPSHICQATSA